MHKTTETRNTFNLQYNPYFSTFEAVESPKITLNFSLYEPMDLSDFASKVTDDGVVIVKENPDFKFDIEQDNRVKTEQDVAVKTDILETIEPITVNLPGKFISNKPQYAKWWFLNRARAENIPLTEYQASAIVGNFMHELGDPTFNDITGPKGDNGSAFGMAQWRDSRLAALRNYAKDNGLNLNDIDTQLEFAWNELKASEKAALNALLKTKTLEEATETFMWKYERPNKKSHHLDRRIEFAKTLR